MVKYGTYVKGIFKDINGEKREMTLCPYCEDRMGYGSNISRIYKRVKCDICGEIQE